MKRSCILAVLLLAIGSLYAMQSDYTETVINITMPENSIQIPLELPVVPAIPTADIESSGASSESEDTKSTTSSEETNLPVEQKNEPIQAIAINQSQTIDTLENLKAIAATKENNIVKIEKSIKKAEATTNNLVCQIIASKLSSEQPNQPKTEETPSTDNSPRKEEARKVSATSWGTYLADLKRGVGPNVLSELKSKKFDCNDITNFDRIDAAFNYFATRCDYPSIIELVKQLGKLEKRLVIKATTANDARLFLKKGQITQEDKTQADIRCEVNSFFNEYTGRVGTILAVLRSELPAIQNAQKKLYEKTRTFATEGHEQSAKLKKSRLTCMTLNNKEAISGVNSSGYDSDFDDSSTSYDINHFMEKRIPATSELLRSVGQKLEKADKILNTVRDECKALQDLIESKK